MYQQKINLEKYQEVFWLSEIIPRSINTYQLRAVCTVSLFALNNSYISEQKVSAS